MADWRIFFLDRGVSPFGPFRPSGMSFSLVNSDEGPMSCEVPFSDPELFRNAIGPYRTDYTIYRGSSIITGGIVTSLNMNKDRQTLMVGGFDWLHYLKRRIYPFDPELYLNGDWANWPKKWGSGSSTGVDTGLIARSLITAMENTGHGAGIFAGTTPTGYDGRYKIFPGDPTTIFDHIRTLSEMGSDGFEFAISPTTGQFFIYPGGRDSNVTQYTLTPSTDEENGAIIDFDWNNTGPRGTWTLGLGSGDKVRNLGSIKTDIESLEMFRQLDIVEDYGQVGSQDMLDKKTAFDGSTNLGPERTLAISILNPAFLSRNFYTGGRPRSLIGNRIRVIYPFYGYRTVNAWWIVNAINFNILESGNEEIGLELEMIPPRLV